jgi:hypothetical protein
MEIESIKPKMIKNRNSKFKSLVNLNSAFYSSPNNELSYNKNKYLSQHYHLFSIPKENKKTIFIKPLLNLSNMEKSCNHFQFPYIIYKNMSFLKYIQNNPHKGLIARMLMDKMNKKQYFSNSQKLSQKTVRKINLNVNQQKKIINYSFNNRKIILLKKKPENKIENNGIKYNNIYDTFKNDFIRDKMKKSLSSDFIL